MTAKTRNEKETTTTKKQDDFDQNVIGTEEAADLLGVTKDHTEELCKRGKLRCRRIGPHCWAIYRPSLLEYLKTKSARGKPPSKQRKIGY